VIPRYDYVSSFSIYSIEPSTPFALPWVLLFQSDRGFSAAILTIEVMDIRGGPISVQHYAFLIDENEFGATFSRIRDEGLRYWADPGKSRPNEINHNDGGSGVYFEDLDGHILEVITRPYGGG
jgi:catechol 2,3-dioxygenase-like lactoylglutathione lyase family enzyme